MFLIVYPFFLVALVLIIFKSYIKFTTGWCQSNVCLTGKTVIITGANSGIGYEAAVDFAKRGARVILACRNEERGKKAETQIIEATDNENIIFKQLDLTSFKSVKEFAKDINATEQRLDILVNNAGAGGLGVKNGEDGLNLTMQTNYYGHFLLTHLLLDLLKKADKSRIVNVSSNTAQCPIGFDINNPDSYPEEGGIIKNELIMYARSKFCIVLFTIELARRLKGTGVSTYTLHPGVAMTDVFRALPYILRWFIHILLVTLFKNTIEGAQTTIYCSVAKGIERHSGKMFRDCNITKHYSSVTQHPDWPEKLWEQTEKLLKLDQD